MTRPYGVKVRQVCEIVDRLGRSHYMAVAGEIPDVPRSNVRKYCIRAVEYGLMQVDKSVRPAMFEMSPGWREMIDRKRIAVVEKVDIPVLGASSVFDLGRIA